jgi:hypothetical protein
LIYLKLFVLISDFANFVISAIFHFLIFVSVKRSLDSCIEIFFSVVFSIFFLFTKIYLHSRSSKIHPVFDMNSSIDIKCFIIHLVWLVYIFEYRTRKRIVLKRVVSKTKAEIYKEKKRRINELYKEGGRDEEKRSM